MCGEYCITLNIRRNRTQAFPMNVRDNISEVQNVTCSRPQNISRSGYTRSFYSLSNINLPDKRLLRRIGKL